MPTNRDELEKLIEDTIGMVSIASSLEREPLKEATVKRMRKEILTALEAAGLRVVPVEATVEMVNATTPHKYSGPQQAKAVAAYTAMLSASPFAPKE